MAAADGLVRARFTAIPFVAYFISGVTFVFTIGYVSQIIKCNANFK
jgi:hypothetical protein